MQIVSISPAEVLLEREQRGEAVLFCVRLNDSVTTIRVTDNKHNTERYDIK